MRERHVVFHKKQHDLSFFPDVAKAQWTSHCSMERFAPYVGPWRLDYAIKKYPEVAKTPDLVWRMATAYAKAEDQADAARSYATYIESFPQGPWVAEAKRRLEVIRQAVNPPTADPSD